MEIGKKEVDESVNVCINLLTSEKNTSTSMFIHTSKLSSATIE